MTAATALLATMLLPMSEPDWHWILAFSLVVVMTGLALLFNAHERKSGQTERGVGFFALCVLVLIFALLTLLPALWIW